jgi:hypothetical protein
VTKFKIRQEKIPGREPEVAKFNTKKASDLKSRKNGQKSHYGLPERQPNPLQSPGVARKTQIGTSTHRAMENRHFLQQIEDHALGV